ncbi:hypothetical protein [Streptomyces sp. NBC_01262]|uniref:hypothetical protein n=1 Tax=Streptomyces sp. NBC_01262 TaxID=2903803 RepID=UPI002E2F5A00|nr:hypothetical protein [Streptomyces sp. NBC_01262]
MPTDKTPVQQHLDDAGRRGGEADRLLSTARREMGLQGADYVRIAAQVQAAGVYAQLAQVSALAAQTAVFLPAADDDQEQ